MGMDADFWRKEKIITATGISQKIVGEKFFGNKCLDSTWSTRSGNLYHGL
jgi:hypothetical protein